MGERARHICIFAKNELWEMWRSSVLSPRCKPSTRRSETFKLHILKKIHISFKLKNWTKSLENTCYTRFVGIEPDLYWSNRIH